MDKRKRYVVAVTSQLTKAKGADAAESSETHENLDCIIKIYNHPDNAYGDFVRVFLASQGYNESIDLKSTRHVHIFEPFFTSDKDIQTIGRASRYCSHKQLNRAAGEWLVQVHRYFSETPAESFNNEQLKISSEIEELKQKIEFLQDIVDRDPEAAANVTEYNNRIDILENQADAIKKMAVFDVKSINDDVQKTAAENSKNLQMIFDTLRANALDCSQFRDFHLSKYPGIKCLQTA
jgi:hypothetical protein